MKNKLGKLFVDCSSIGGSIDVEDVNYINIDITSLVNEEIQNVLKSLSPKDFKDIYVILPTIDFIESGGLVLELSKGTYHCDRYYDEMAMLSFPTTDENGNLIQVTISVYPDSITVDYQSQA